MRTSIFLLIYLNLSSRIVGAQISEFFKNGPACVTDCPALSSANRDCQQLGRVDANCLCTNVNVGPLLDGDNCGCSGQQGVAFRDWLGGQNLCAGLVKAATTTTTEAASSTGESTPDSTTGSATTASNDESTITSAPATLSTITGKLTNLIPSTSGPKSSSTAAASSSVAGGSFEKNKKWAIPVIAVVVAGALGIVGILFWFHHRRSKNEFDGYSGVKNGKTHKPSGPWYMLGLGTVFAGRRKRGRESTMSEASKDLVGNSEYNNTFSPPRPRMSYDPYGYNANHGRQGGHIAPGSYPHGRPLSPVEEIRSQAPTPSIHSITSPTPPPPHEHYRGHAEPSTFHDIPESEVSDSYVGGQGSEVSALTGYTGPLAAGGGGAATAGTAMYQSRAGPAAPSSGYGVGGGQRQASGSSLPSRQSSVTSQTSTVSSLSDSSQSTAPPIRQPNYGVATQRKPAPVRRMFNPDGGPPTRNDSVGSSNYSTVSPISPSLTPPPLSTSPPIPPISPLRYSHPKPKPSPQYYEDPGF